MSVKGVSYQFMNHIADNLVLALGTKKPPRHKSIPDHSLFLLPLATLILFPPSQHLQVSRLRRKALFRASHESRCHFL